MACTVINGIAKGCDNNVGGLKQILALDQDDVLTVTIDTATHKVTAITKNAVVAKDYYFKRNQANFNEEEQRDLNEGSNFIRNTVSISFKRREAAKSKEIKILGEGQRDIALFTKDYNNIWWYIPNAQLATNAGGSGAEKANGSKYDVTFVAEYEFTAYEVEEAVITSLLS